MNPLPSITTTKVLNYFCGSPHLTKWRALWSRDTFMNTERLLQGANLWLHIYKSSHSSGKKPWKNETKMNAYQYEQKRKQWWRRENAHDPKHNPPSVKHVRWLFTANAILTCTAYITVCSITYWLIDLYCNKIIIQWFIDLTVFL